MIKLKPNPRFIRRPEGRGRERRSPTRICSRNQKTRTSRTVCEKYGEETADKRGSQRWWWKGDRRRDGKAVRREDGRQVDRKKTTEEADRGDGSQRSERWSKGYKPRHAEVVKRADQRRAKRPRCETTEADPKKPTGDVHRDYKAVLLAMIRHIGVGEVRKQLGEVEMGYNPAKEKRQDDASRELSRSKEKRQEEANAIEGREENDPPEQELTETETASGVSEPPEASNTKELANIEAATRARQDARLRVPVQQDNGNGRFGIGMPLYLVGARKELRENAEKRESDLKNKENDEKQEEKRNKHAAEVKARAARAMEKHVTTSPPKSAASEQGCRCDAVDDIETPAGFCLNTQNQSVRKPAPTAPRSSQAAGISQCTRIADVPPPPDRYKTNEYNDLCRRKQVHHLSPTARTDSTAEITATTHQTSWLGLLAESFRQLTHIQQAAFTAVNDTLALGNMQFETLKDAIQLGKQMLDKVSVKEKGPEAPYPHLSGLPMHVPVLFDMQGGTEDAVLGKVVDFADVATMQNYTDARHTGIIPSFLSDSCLATCKKAAHLDKRLQDPFNDILDQSPAEYRIFEKSYFQVDKGAKLPKLLNNIRSLLKMTPEEIKRTNDIASPHQIVLCWCANDVAHFKPTLVPPNSSPNDRERIIKRWQQNDQKYQESLQAATEIAYILNKMEHKGMVWGIGEADDWQMPFFGELVQPILEKFADLYIVTWNASKLFKTMPRPIKYKPGIAPEVDHWHFRDNDQSDAGFNQWKVQLELSKHLYAFAMFGNFLYLLEESTEAVKTFLRMQNQHQSGTMNNLASRRVVQDYLHTSPASSSNLPNMPNPRDSAVTRPPVPVRPVSPPKSTASEQGCRCNAVDDIETPAGFCLNTQNQSVWKPAPTAPVSSEAAGSSQCTRIAHVPAALQAVMTSALAPPLATPEALSTPQTAVTLHGATAEKATKEETAATTKTEETSALGAAKNEAGNVNEPSAWNRRVLRRKGRPKRQAKEKLHVRRESSVEDSSQRRHQPPNIAMRIYNGVGTTTEMIEK